MGYRLFFMVMWCILAAGCAEPRLRVVTYNVQAAFDASPCGMEFAGYEPSLWRETDVLEKSLRLARVIRSGGRVDVLCLQEIENPHVMSALLDGAMPFSGLAYRVFAKGPDGAFGLGIASRYPVLRATAHACYPGFEGARPILEAQVMGPRGPVNIICVHWKSRRGDEEVNRQIREMERNATLRLIDAATGLPRLAAGDFNTEDAGLGGRERQDEATWGMGAGAETFDHAYVFGGGAADWSVLRSEAYAEGERPVGYGIRDRRGASDHWPVALRWDYWSNS